MNEEEFNHWKLTREKGKFQYTFFYGFLSYGLPMLVIMAFVNTPFINGYTVESILTHIITWSISGIIFGISMWYFNEYKYKKEIVSRSNT